MGQPDDQLITEAAAEVVRLGNYPLAVEANIATWFDLIALLQLALRHQGAAQQPIAQRGEKFVRDLIEQMDPGHGQIWRLLMYGFDPEHDQKL